MREFLRKADSLSLVGFSLTVLIIVGLILVWSL